MLQQNFLEQVSPAYDTPSSLGFVDVDVGQTAACGTKKRSLDFASKNTMFIFVKAFRDHNKVTMAEILQESPTKANSAGTDGSIMHTKDPVNPSKRSAPSPQRNPTSRRIKIDKTTKGLESDPELWEIAFQDWMLTRQQQKQKELWEFRQLEVEMRKEELRREEQV